MTLPLLIPALVAAMAFAVPADAGPRPVTASPSVFVPTIVFEQTADAPGTATVTRVFSTQATDVIVNGIDEARQFCGSIGNSAYAVDCLSERLAAVASAMPAGGGYGDARAALLDASRKLNALARANAAPDLPRANVRQPGEGGIATTRPLIPVDPARLAEVSRAAEAIVAEAETVLLRSAESVAERTIHYTRIATAVGSNKALLRSA